jgi:hypothetical protein
MGMLFATNTTLLHTNYTVKNKSTVNTMSFTMWAHSIISQQIIYLKTVYFRTKKKDHNTKMDDTNEFYNEKT